MSRIDPHDPLAGPDPLAPALGVDGSGATPHGPGDTPTPVRHPAGGSCLNPKERLVRKPVYHHLAVHQRGEQEWDYHFLAGTLDAWYERLDRHFGLALPRVPLRLDPRIRHTCAGYFRAGHNEFGLACEIAVRVPPATGLAALDLGDVIGTLLHELLHLKQELTGVPGKDNYHNVAFRRLAAGVGLVVDARGRQAYEPDGAFLDLLRTHGIAPPAAAAAPRGVAAGTVPPTSPSPVRVAPRRSRLAKWTCGCTNVWVGVRVLYARCDRCGGRFLPAGDPGR